MGEVTLSFEYTGILNDQMRGFYRSKYTSPEAPDEERYAAVTQFEAADARRALPCWDEPAIKATFDVVLVIPKNRVGLSNMVREEEREREREREREGEGKREREEREREREREREERERSMFLPTECGE